MLSPAPRQVILLYCWLILGCWLCSPLRAEGFLPFQLGEPQPVFRNINASNGLPSSETYAVYQDRNGYIWIATDRGVVRYDGYRFRTFTKKDGLADDVIFRLIEDPKGRIWFVSYNSLLSYYENGKIHPYKYNHHIRKFMGGLISTFKYLVVDEQDNIYYAIHSIGGIAISHSGTVTPLPHPEYSGVTIRKIGASWLPVFYMNNLPRHWKDIPIELIGQGSTSRIARQYLTTIMNISWSRSGAFLQADDVVYDLVRQRKLFEEKVAIGVSCQGNYLFTGLFKRGVRMEDLRLPERHPNRTRYLLQGYSVSNVLRDREGGYWFTTLEKGVFYTPGLAIRSYTARQGITHLEYCDINGLGKDIYVSDLMGCTRITTPVSRIALNGVRRRVTVGASKKKVYINGNSIITKASDDGRYVFTPSHLHHAFSMPHSVIVTGGCTMRIFDDGTTDTLYRYKPDKKGSSWKQTFFLTVAESPAGRIYAGNMNGLFELRNREAISLERFDRLFNVQVTDLEVHPDLHMVVATRGSGIYCFDEQHRITTRITRKNGLPGDQVDCLYADKEGNLYAGTNHGLAIFRLQNGKLEHQVLTTKQGLCSDEINAIYRSGNQLWVGTREGVSVVDLDQLPHIQRGCIRFASFSVNNKGVDPVRFSGELPSDVMVVQLALRTTNFSGAGIRRFAYQLRRGGGWFMADEPEIVLNEPRSGDYAISVKCMNDEGAWSKPVRLIRFSVAKPFYLLWYWIVLVSVIVFLFAFWMFRIVLRRVQQRHAYQTTINQLEQKALRAQMNPHFIFNSLNSIQSFLVYEENEKAERYLLKFAQLIRQTLNNSRESYITIESEMETLRRYLELEQMRFKDKFGFTITCNLSPSELLHGVPPMLIQPFVENAVLHGFQSVESGGLIEVVFVSLENHRLLCIVEDNGVGRKATEKHQPQNHKSFGTRITAERLAAFRQKYGDNFSIETIDKEVDGRPSGTKVLLRIPVVSPAEVLPLED